MTPAVFLAHVLALHLHVPEPVSFVIRDLWPAEVEAHILRFGPVGIPTGWQIEYDRTAWDRYPKKRIWVIAHEVCHAVYDHTVEDWSELRYSEQGIRHARIDACAAQILRDCHATRLKVILSEKPLRQRYVLARIELEELLEKEAR